jgi:hypothetical protein
MRALCDTEEIPCPYCSLKGTRAAMLSLHIERCRESFHATTKHSTSTCTNSSLPRDSSQSSPLPTSVQYRTQFADCMYSHSSTPPNSQYGFTITTGHCDLQYRVCNGEHILNTTQWSTIERMLEPYMVLQPFNNETNNLVCEACSKDEELSIKIELGKKGAPIVTMYLCSWDCMKILFCDITSRSQWHNFVNDF